MPNMSFIQFSQPCLDHPFGLHLWPIFSHIYELIFGYPADQFRFVQNQTYLANGYLAISVIAVYYVIIFGYPLLAKSFNIRPFSLSIPFQIHNFILSSGSLVLFLLIVEQILPVVVRHGFYYGVCSPKAYTNQLVVLYYINYLIKYFELIDTFFLVLKRKKLLFLHTYHHGATALLCYSQLRGYTTVEWVPIVLNLAVHVIMYFYYFLSARGIRVWWKKYITLFQITQFVLDLFVVYYALYQFYADTYWNWLPHSGGCHGTHEAGLYGAGILASYLVLFISFYFKSYSKPVAKKEKTGTATGVTSGADVKKTAVKSRSRKA